MQVYNHLQIVLQCPLDTFMQIRKRLFVLSTVFMPQHFFINRQAYMVESSPGNPVKIRLVHSLLYGKAVLNPLRQPMAQVDTSFNLKTFCEEA